MLQFSKLDREKIEAFRPYFSLQDTHISDFSIGFQFMWGKHLSLDYAIFGDTLILRELFAGKYYFYYPISLSKSEEREREAIEEIEKYCRDNDIRLHFTNVPRRALPFLALRYAEAAITDIRRWRDYLYDAAAFSSFEGKKYAGQRNHIHKFEREYPDRNFRPLHEEDLPKIEAFLQEYEETRPEKHEYLAETELSEVHELLPRLWELKLYCGGLFVGGRLVGFSVGERCGDMVVVHIEKALRGIEGAYPMLAREFAKSFAGDARFLNRMDDAGDLGLRKSKLQYLPCELVDKYNVVPARAIDSVSYPPEIQTPRLNLAPLSKKDDEKYFRLASDIERNRYWGYDWREARKDTRKPAISWFRKCTEEDFHRRLELSLGIFLQGELVGEVVLHRFGYHAEAEIGVRLLPEAEGQGYAREAVRALTDHAFSKFNLEVMEAKCFRENIRSKAMLEGAGMRNVGMDETYFYFRRTAEM